MVESIVGKGENAGYQHFLPFNYIFNTILLKGNAANCDSWVSSRDCVVKHCETILETLELQFEAFLFFLQLFSILLTL